MTAELCSFTVHIDTGRWSETVLTTVDLLVQSGRITAVLGGPGAGKTMLAYALTGHLPGTAQGRGEVLINGRPVPDDGWPELRGGTVGYIPQEGVTAFDPGKTVGAQLRELEQRHHAWTVRQACAAAHYPEYASNLLPHENSGGQIQRAALAAALIPAPAVLIADSPAASLDRETAYQVWKSLREFADSGAAVLAISNDVPMLTAGGFADRMVIMHAGRILASGSPAQLAESKDPEVGALIRSGR